jgi:hypothetical protein
LRSYERTQGTCATLNERERDAAGYYGNPENTIKYHLLWYPHTVRPLPPRSQPVACLVPFLRRILATGAAIGPALLPLTSAWQRACVMFLPASLVLPQP